MCTDPKQMLFVGFPGTMHRLFFKGVDADDLALGLFLFSCARERVITPGAAGEPVETVVTECPKLHQQLVEALLVAEAEGRARWAPPGERGSFELLNELLVANGCSPSMSDSEFRLRHPGEDLRYNDPNVERRCPQLKVIWRRLRW